jgi:hypothetical protein
MMDAARPSVRLANEKIMGKLAGVQLEWAQAE